MTPLTIREATRQDFKQVRVLIQELAEYVQMPNSPKISEKDLARDAFDVHPPLFHCLVVDDPCDPSKLIAYAIYYFTYGTWTGKKLFLEDIYVTESHRGRKIGDALFRSVVKKGEQNNCSVMDFFVFKWNPARDFYHARGAVNLTEKEGWHYYQLSPPATKILCQGG